jgi:MOSC domain-containing protein YiiM
LGATTSSNDSSKPPNRLLFRRAQGRELGNDAIEMLTRDVKELKVADVTWLFLEGKHDLEMLQRALGVEALPESWKNHFRRNLEELRASS